MSGVLNALASQIGASVEATIFLLSLFIGKANLCLCQNRCHETNRISYVIIHYAVLQCSCVFLKMKLGLVCNQQNFKFLYYCMNIVRTLMNLYKSNIFCFYIINYLNEIFFLQDILQDFSIVPLYMEKMKIFTMCSSQQQVLLFIILTLVSYSCMMHFNIGKLSVY